MSEHLIRIHRNISGMQLIRLLFVERKPEFGITSAGIKRFEIRQSQTSLERRSRCIRKPLPLELFGQTLRIKPQCQGIGSVISRCETGPYIFPEFLAFIYELRHTTQRSGEIRNIKRIRRLQQPVIPTRKYGNLSRRIIIGINDFHGYPRFQINSATERLGT